MIPVIGHPPLVRPSRLHSGACDAPTAYTHSLAAIASGQPRTGGVPLFGFPSRVL